MSGRFVGWSRFLDAFERLLPVASEPALLLTTFERLPADVSAPAPRSDTFASL